MKHTEITTVEELKELMDKEAEKWGRTDAENATVNSHGIEEQWQGILSKDETPLPIFGLIYDDAVVEHEDGSKGMTFQMYSFWFDKEGQRVERPNIVIE